MESRLLDVLNVARSEIPFYRDRAPARSVALDDWPLISKADLAESFDEFCRDGADHAHRQADYLVASGGSTAKPVYSRYGLDEVERLTRNLGFHFQRNGIVSGDRVLNYFGAGDMCGAFSMVDRALACLPVTILPVSFTPNMDFALEVIQRFRPNAIVGIPTLLVHLARRCHEQGLGTHLDKVFYGGESMTSGSAELLRSLWNCTLIRSAGYASTEAGAIGWQCTHGEPGEHFVFDDNLVEIVDDEIVVTSLSRTLMPLIRFRTGDRGEWVQPRCQCGNGAPALRLLGRLDTSMIVWGCWLRYEDILRAFQALQVPFIAVQVEITSSAGEDFLHVHFETENLSFDQASADHLRARIHEFSGDLNLTFSLDAIRPLLKIQAMPPGTLRRNGRTGKVIPIVDART